MLLKVSKQDADRICADIKEYSVEPDHYPMEIGEMQLFAEMAGKCKSPIEAILFWKMVARFGFNETDPMPSYDFKYDASGLMIGNEDTDENSTDSGKLFGGKIACIGFFVQHELIAGGHLYRVDFLIEGMLPGKPGIPFNREDYLRRKFKIVIEADGHDFHEKTKVQAKRDKGRDRDLALEGYTVLHFTGSEIWNDSDSVVDEICGQILKKAEVR